MQTKRIHYTFAAISFLVALITYTMTMQPTIPFWDCGEFAAAASALSVPHPPGAPLWTLVGRVGMLLPIFTDPVARYNWLSVLSSAATIMLLYLTVVRLIRLWRGEPRSMADVMTHYGGAFLAALCFTWTDSFWFNALECEVYAFGSLFIALVPWLALVWYDHSEDEHNEKFLLLIAYVIGLSLGVHQLALLTLFPVFMLVWYRRQPNPTVKGFLIMAGVACVAFIIAFKIILSNLVQWMGNGLGVVSVILVAGMIGAIIWSQRERKAVVNLAAWSALLIFLGYTTYGSIMVRASQDPPMNQWHASNFNILSKYINREQYGEATQFPRRKEQSKMEPNTKATWENYSSDADFFWRYQTNHMYTRYLGWNFIGREHDDEGAGVDFWKTGALPFLFGLFGLYWHFRRDPKRAFSLLGAFIMLGFLTAWYQNQQDSQPRERDYFYVGAFYVYAMWVGIGVTGLIEICRAKFRNTADTDTAVPAALLPTHEEDSVPVFNGGGNAGLAMGLLALCVVLVPINQVVGLVGLAKGYPLSKSSKWMEYSRYHNYIPYDYAYNILQSCDNDAILFTAGDNDTFPLWCLQDVYGVRRDVRIVNLSLGNMSWYIKQLKNLEPWGAKKVNLPSFTDDLLAQPDDSQLGVHDYPDDARETTVSIRPETMGQFTGKAEPGNMTWRYTGEIDMGNGKYYYRIADQLVRDIVQGNIDTRPIYFAAAVPPSYMIGLDPYLSFEGMVGRVTPIRYQADRTGLDAHVDEAKYLPVAYNVPKEPLLTPDRGMLVRTYNDPAAHRSALDDRYGTQSYFFLYARLANYFVKAGKMPEAQRALDTLTARIPPDRVTYEPQYLQFISELYGRTGNSEKALKYMNLSTQGADRTDNSLTGQFRLGSMYMNAGQTDSARAIFTRIRGQLKDSPADQQYLDFKLAVIDARSLEQKGNKSAAIQKYTEILATYGSMASQNPTIGDEMNDVKARLESLGAPSNSKTDTGAAPVAPATQDGVGKAEQGAKPGAKANAKSGQ